MFPGVYGFSWSPGYLVFLGLFFSVGLVIAGTLILAVFRALRDFRSRKADSIAWKVDFSDLPEASRSCRHELTGETVRRVCERGFDCRECAGHVEFERRRSQVPARPASGPARSTVYGYEMPPDRLYHRGHTWVRSEDDGTLLVGLDDFAARLLGTPDQVVLPGPGEQLAANGAAVQLRRGRSRVRILSPVDGEVIEAGGEGTGWRLRLRPASARPDLSHLLRAHEVGPWILREIDRLRIMLAGGASHATFADGGLPVGDLTQACPEADWDAVWSDAFLQP